MRYFDFTIDGERVGSYEIDERPGLLYANPRLLVDGTPEVVSEGRWHLFPPGGAG